MESVEGVTLKSESEIGAQLRLVEHGIGERFKFLEEDQRVLADLIESGFSHGIRAEGDEVIFPGEGKVINFKEKYPEQYERFLSGLRSVRKCQALAVSEFVSQEKVQQYPVFLPVWHNPVDEYEDNRFDDEWINNTDQNYFLNHRLIKEHLMSIPERGKVFYSHGAIGPGVESFASVLPKTEITVGDINDRVREKCKRHLLGKGIKNVAKWNGSPAEYLSEDSDQFDAVYTHEAIWVNPYRAFSEYVRVVKDGGVIVGSCKPGFDHDTLVFFKNFSDIYGAESSIVRDADFSVLSIKVTEEMKQKFKTDKMILDVLYGQLLPDRDNSEQFPDVYRNDFKVYEVDKVITLKQMADLGLAKKDIESGLKRLCNVACGLNLVVESSFSAVAYKVV
jgi:hypothetical protein